VEKPLHFQIQDSPFQFDDPELLNADHGEQNEDQERVSAGSQSRSNPFHFRPEAESASWPRAKQVRMPMRAGKFPANRTSSPIEGHSSATAVTRRRPLLGGCNWRYYGGRLRIVAGKIEAKQHLATAIRVEFNDVAISDPG
jgi:hypothetical protein